MNGVHGQVERWKRAHRDELIQCRWGARITAAACRAYQTRRARYITHFQSQKGATARPNAEYLRCCNPGPCPHLISDEELAELTPAGDDARDAGAADRRNKAQCAREFERLSSPNAMLSEADWKRSLIKR